MASKSYIQINIYLVEQHLRHTLHLLSTQYLHCERQCQKDNTAGNCDGRRRQRKTEKRQKKKEEDGEKRRGEKESMKDGRMKEVGVKKEDLTNEVKWDRIKSLSSFGDGCRLRKYWGGGGGRGGE